MKYKETLNWLYNQLPMYQKIGAIAYKPNLNNSMLLDGYLKNPHQYFKTIHVAGTNGKGSTSSLLASVLMEAGYKVGLYTSPHLKDFRERISINGKHISKQFIFNFVEKHKTFFETNDLSFFEMTVGLAFKYFETKKVDVAIIEVGLGGRLDATNIINPLVSVITNIGLDHMQFLGDTLAKIAFEKAGIIKPNIPVIIGEYVDETKPVFTEIAKKNNAEIYFASHENYPNYPSELLGDYQKTNKKTVIKTFEILKNKFNITEEHLKNGIKSVVTNTHLQGRWQILQQNPKVIADTAHNAHGLKMAMQQLITEKHTALHLVFGMVNDKDLTEILPLLPKNATYYFCKPKTERGLPTTTLQKIAATHQLYGKTYKSVKLALKAALKNTKTTDIIYVGGSTFVVAEVV